MQWLKDKYVALRDWAHDSETILLARFQVVSGVVIMAFSAADWSPLTALFGTNTGFDWKQAFWTGGGIAVKGIIDEVARRYRATDL